MTPRHLLRILSILIFAGGAVAAASALAERTLVEGTVQIDGQQRRYYRLHDVGSADKAVPILLISGSGCRAFGQRIVGFCEGGMVAPIVASRSAKIGWLATGGSGGLPQSEEFLIFHARGVGPYATLFTRETLLQAYAAIKADPDNTDKEFFGHSYRYWSSHLFHDPLPVHGQLTIPIVAAMGEQDDSVPIESGRRLRDFFAARPDKPFTFIAYRHAGHALQAPDENHLVDYIAGLAHWFKGKPDSFESR